MKMIGHHGSLDRLVEDLTHGRVGSTGGLCQIAVGQTSHGHNGLDRALPVQMQFELHI